MALWQFQVRNWKSPSHYLLLVANRDSHSCLSHYQPDASCSNNYADIDTSRMTVVFIEDTSKTGK